MSAAAVPIVFGAALLARLRGLAQYPDMIFGDARLYFRATQAWLAHGDPWSAQDAAGVAFAAPPPALLLNVPFQAIGEDAAVAFWLVAGLLGVAAAIRHYHLPWWWIAFPPCLDGIFPASPDPAMLGALVLGGGAVAAVTKWYAVPAMLGEGRWRAALIGAGIGLVSLPLLPWGEYFSRLPEIQDTYQRQGTGQLPLIVVIVLVVAVLSLGRKGLLLAAPVLWPTPQPHYAIFSLAAIRESRLLAIGFGIPGAAPLAVLLYAIVVAFRRLIPRTSRDTTDSIASPQQPGTGTRGTFAD